MNSSLTLDEIKQIVFQLPIQEQITLIEDLEEKLATMQMMQLAETGFSAIADLVGWVEPAKPNKKSSLKISAIALSNLKY
jgi:hypothetical protein